MPTYTGTVWYDWCSNTCTSGTCTSGGVWTTWTNATSSCTGTTSTDVWGYWNTAADQGTTAYPYQARAPQLTAEERERQEQAREAARAAEQERAKQRQAAVERAKGLLLSHMTREQRAQLKRFGFFIVQAKSGNRYRIHSGRVAGNIERLADNDNNRATHRFCVHVPYSYGLPEPDHLLAQKLMLEAAEEEVLRVANQTRLAA